MGKYHDPRQINAGSFGNATCYFCRIGMHSLQLQLLFDRRPVVTKGFLQHTPVVFGDDQQSSLEDYKEASTMLSYNQNCRLSEGDVI